MVIHPPSLFLYLLLLSSLSVFSLVSYTLLDVNIIRKPDLLAFIELWILSNWLRLPSSWLYLTGHSWLICMFAILCNFSVPLSGQTWRLLYFENSINILKINVSIDLGHNWISWRERPEGRQGWRRPTRTTGANWTSYWRKRPWRSTGATWRPWETRNSWSTWQGRRTRRAREIRRQGEQPYFKEGKAPWQSHVLLLQYLLVIVSDIIIFFKYSNNCIVKCHENITFLILYIYVYILGRKRRKRGTRRECKLHTNYHITCFIGNMHIQFLIRPCNDLPIFSNWSSSDHILLNTGYFEH